MLYKEKGLGIAQWAMRAALYEAIKPLMQGMQLA